MAGNVTLWDAVGGVRLASQQVAKGETSVSFSPDGTLLSAVPMDGSQRAFLMDATNAQVVQEFNAIHWLTFTPDGTSTPVGVTMDRKAIQELFEMDYGRMNALLGVARLPRGKADEPCAHWPGLRMRQASGGSVSDSYTLVVAPAQAPDPLPDAQPHTMERRCPCCGVGTLCLIGLVPAGAQLLALGLASIAAVNTS